MATPATLCKKGSLCQYLRFVGRVESNHTQPKGGFISTVPPSRPKFAGVYNFTTKPRRKDFYEVKYVDKKNNTQSAPGFGGAFCDKTNGFVLPRLEPAARRYGLY